MLAVKQVAALVLLEQITKSYARTAGDASFTSALQKVLLLGLEEAPVRFAFRWIWRLKPTLVLGFASPPPPGQCTCRSFRLWPFRR